MDFKDQILALSGRVVKLREEIQTEEATKMTLIMPFLQCLGYDVFNPLEVIPEYTADIGTKKGEKVDYAIVKDGKPILIFECKHWSDDLTSHTSQLIRYFSVTEAKFAILTNGIRYQFFSDLEEKNKMDEKPFLDFDITQMPEPIVNELKKFHKSYFDIDEIITTASELKYSNEVKRILREELRNPSVNFVKYLIKLIYDGKATEKVVASFTQIIKKSAGHLITELVNEKIKAALEKDDKKDESMDAEEEQNMQTMQESEGPEIETTEEELEGYAIVKAILRGKGIAPERISYKDTLQYFSIIFDKSTFKPICRLRLYKRKKYIIFFDENKKTTKHGIESVDDIYKYDAQLLEAVQRYEQGVSEEKS
jgi:hypothetical protein